MRDWQVLMKMVTNFLKISVILSFNLFVHMDF